MAICDPMRSGPIKSDQIAKFRETVNNRDFYSLIFFFQKGFLNTKQFCLFCLFVCDRIRHLLTGLHCLIFSVSRCCKRSFDTACSMHRNFVGIHNLFTKNYLMIEFATYKRLKLYFISRVCIIFSQVIFLFFLSRLS